MEYSWRRLTDISTARELRSLGREQESGVEVKIGPATILLSCRIGSRDPQTGTGIV